MEKHAVGGGEQSNKKTLSGFRRSISRINLVKLGFGDHIYTRRFQRLSGPFSQDSSGHVLLVIIRGLEADGIGNVAASTFTQ